VFRRFLNTLCWLLCALTIQADPLQHPADSLRKLLLTGQRDGIARAEILIRLAGAEKTRNVSVAELYAGEAMGITRLHDDNSLKAKACHVMGQVQEEQNRFDSAIVLYSEAIQLFTAPSDHLDLAITHNERGICFENKGNYQAAYQDYLSALKIYEELHDQRGIANEYLNLGLIHEYRNELKEAESYFRKALAINRSIKAEDGIASALNNLGIVYQQQKQYEEALVHFQQVLAIDMQNKDEQNIASSLNNIGTVTAEMGRHKEALEYYQQSAEIKSRLNDMIGLSNTYNNIASSLVSLSRLDEAESYLKRSEKLSRQYGFSNNIVETYEIYYKLHLARKNYEKALAYFQLFRATGDSIRNNENELAIHRMKNEYQLDKANAELNIKNTQLEAEQQSRVLYIIIILLLITVSFFLYLNSKRIRNLYKVLHAQHKDLIEAKEKAEEATKIKSQFLSVMSHEIRTPLNAIIGIANLLSDEIRQDRHQENIRVLHSSSQNLMRLINDLLDLSKLEVGKMEIDQGKVGLKKVCENIREMFAVLAAEKGIVLRLDFDESIPATLRGDDVKLSQAITNLVGNAIKFTQNGTVVLSLKLLYTHNDETAVAFSVTDTGIGIPKDKQQSIFDSFIQVSSDTNKKFGGTGLGLSISKKLVEAMGGKLSVVSDVGKGSAFSFDLVFRNIQVPDEESAEVITEDVLYKGKQILIADDNPVNVFVLRQFLQKWGATTMEAADGNQVMSLLKEHRFDMVLMDIQMPEKDGIEATREIRSSGQAWSNIPVIAITASHEEEVKDKIRESGMNDFVIKPFMPDELTRKISRVFNIS
jgi:signal transduction histidine kinase/CheY-like chemotaxis protein/Flp pilus assembly protein TadD